MTVFSVSELLSGAEISSLEGLSIKIFLSRYKKLHFSMIENGNDSLSII